MFNLPAPSGFRGLHPDLPVTCYKRHMPHWRQAGATYFVTFRLADSIPQEHLRSLKRWREIWEKSHPEPRSEMDWTQLAREITARTEAWMDEGYGECVLRQPQLAQETAQALLHFQNQRCLVGSFVIMPNHVHVVMKPLGEYSLEDNLKSVKQFITNRAKVLLGRSGTLWTEESYDRIVRDDEHLYRVVQYIGRNPKKAGLKEGEYVRWLLPDWEQAGYGFIA